MGATTQRKIQVAFSYLMTSLTAEWEISVVANIYPCNCASIENGRPTESDSETWAEVVSAVYSSKSGKRTVWDDIPAFIREDIEDRAKSIAVLKYNFT